MPTGPYNVYQFQTKDGQKIATLKPVEHLTKETITFEALAEKTVKGVCNADAPCAHASCETTVKETPSTSPNNLKIVEFYQKMVNDPCPGGVDVSSVTGEKCNCTKSEKEVGPIYFIDTYATTKGHLFMLELQSEILESGAYPVSNSDLKSIADSVGGI